MKRRIFAAALSLLLVFLSLPAFVYADAPPTTKAEFIAAYSEVNELLFGYEHFGSPRYISEPITRTADPYLLRLTTEEGFDTTSVNPRSGFFNVPTDLVVYDSDRMMVLEFLDPLPASICLGPSVRSDAFEYLPDTFLLISVNGGDWRSYTTAASAAENVYIVNDSAGISSLRIYRDTSVHGDDVWPGISYILLPAKLEQAAPAAPTVADRTLTSIRLTEIPGAEYRMGEGDWTDDPHFTGLSPATEYTFYARYAETETFHATSASSPTFASTDKGTQTAPAAPLVAEVTPFSVTLQTIPGAQYKKDDGDWQNDPEFTYLIPGMDYLFYARLKETDTLHASPSSAGTAVTTPTHILRTLTHSPSGISMTGTIHIEAELLVEEAVLHEPGECAACDAIRQRMKDDAYLSLLLVDISLDFVEATPYSLPVVMFGVSGDTPPPGLYTGQLTLTIPVDAKYNGKTLTVLHCAQGTLKTYTSLVKDGKITLTVTELSPFGVFADAELPAGDDSPPATGASGSFQILGLLSLGLAGAFLILRQRRRGQDA